MWQDVEDEDHPRLRFWSNMLNLQSKMSSLIDKGKLFDDDSGDYFSDDFSQLYEDY